MSHAASTAVFRHSQSKGSSRLVLLAMADEANDEGLLTAYRRSHRHIAKKANIDERTVTRAVHDLESLGELQVLAAGNGRASTDYRITLPGIEGWQDATPGVADRVPRDGDVPPQGGRDATPIIPFSPGDTRSSPSSAPMFDEFWRAFPRKEGKGAARKAWEKATTKAVPAAIVRGVYRYADDPNRDPAYTCHPATWLNQERWDDDPLPPRSNGRGSVGTRTVASLTGMERRRALGPPPAATEFTLTNGETATFTTTRALT